MKTKDRACLQAGFSGILILIVVGVLAVLGLIAFSQISKRGGEVSMTPQSATEINDQERKFIALGASYTKANNLSANLIGDNPEYSFATGTKIDSIYLYLKTNEKSLTAVNLAESGANSQNILRKQAPNAVDFHPKYVTIDIAADIFEDSTPEKLIKNLGEIITSVKDKDTVVIVGSYPNLPKLRTASFPACKEDKLKVGIDKVTSKKIQDFNRVISDFAREKGIIFVDVYDVLDPSDVSDYDCVHPNVDGQKKLAQAWIEALKKAR